MQNIKKYIMTLALLLTAVTGAWADETLLLTIENKDYTSFTYGSKTFDDKVTVTFSEEVYNDGDLDGWYAGSASLMTVTGTNGYTITSCKFYTNEGIAATGYTVVGESPSVYLSGGYVYTDASKSLSIGTIGITKIEVYGAAEPTEWSLTPDADKKVWTLAKMPASNVELQVEYYAESNLFLGKEALADKANIAVTAGETAVDFGDDGKSANTVTEGTPMTVKFNGTKKLLGVKVEEKKAVDPANAYLKWDADQKKLVATEIPAEATKVENSTSYVEWSGTYVVEGNVTITGNITLSGNVNLIIKDGATLTAKKIIGYNNNLSIYGQANQTGQLVVDNSGDDAITSMKTLEVHSAKLTATTSYSDRGAFCLIGTFNVYGGSVDATATGSHGGYGIWLGTDGSMNIYGGEVKAVGKGTGSYSYGITANNSSTVTVNGGKLWAENADKKALRDVNIQKGAGFSGKIEYSSDKSTWSETVDADAKYVRAGY